MVEGGRGRGQERWWVREVKRKSKLRIENKNGNDARLAAAAPGGLAWISPIKVSLFPHLLKRFHMSTTASAVRGP